MSGAQHRQKSGKSKPLRDMLAPRTHVQLSGEAI
jgi:hypothetical protein